MNDLVVPAMSLPEIAKVRQLEAAAAERPQVDIPIDHTFHAGIYSRTAHIPAGVLITGALIKIPTTLILNGDVVAYGPHGAVRYVGFHILSAEAGRKMAFYAFEETSLTMQFATDVKTVEQAENEFTDEVDLLTSRKQKERKCLE